MSQKAKNVSALTLKDYVRMNSDEYRRSHNPFGDKPTPEHDGDCNNCPHIKSMSNPAKGARISGGFGKCTRPTGPCANPVPALGIGGVASTFKKVEKVPMKCLKCGRKFNAGAGGVSIRCPYCHGYDTEPR